MTVCHGTTTGPIPLFLGSIRFRNVCSDVSFLNVLEGGGTRDDLNQFSSDDSLSGSVEHNGQLVDHLTWNMTQS